MAKTRQAKELTLTALADQLSRMKALVFTSFSGLTVKDATTLRNELREAGVEYMVAKKTLLRKALKEAHLDPAMLDQVDGMIAVAVGYEDEVLPAKLLQGFSKTHPAVTLVGGIVEGKFITGPEVIALAKLPNKEQLIAQTVWTIKAPLTGLVGVLAGNIRSLLTVLTALQDKQPASAGA